MLDASLIALLHITQKGDIVAPPPAFAVAALSRITDWQGVPALAEVHGLAPLLSRTLAHSKAALPALPGETRRTLAGLALRHRLVARARQQALAEIYRGWQGVQPLLVLKGAALAHLLYPEPGLRPMRDIDLLCAEADLPAAQSLLQRLGYTRGGDAHRQTGHRHLPAYGRDGGGFHISVEMHHALYHHPNGTPGPRMQDLARPFLDFEPALGTTAQALGLEDMLYHLCWHAYRDNDGLAPMRLVHAVDIAAFAARFSGQIDWACLQRQHPLVAHTLSALHLLIPLPESVLQRTGAAAGLQYAGVGSDLQGWPVLPTWEWRKSGLLRVFRDTFFPAPWWLYLHYGRNRKMALVELLARHWANLTDVMLRQLAAHRGVG